MSDLIITQDTSQSPFDSIRKLDEQGNEFWSARDLMPLLGYPRWNEFKEAVKRAIVSCEVQQGLNEVSKHFSGTTQKSLGRSGEDYKLSRLASYLVSMNGDPRKSEVASAQAYFVSKTREAELKQQPPEIKYTTIQYVEAATHLNQLPEHNMGMLKQLLIDSMVDEIELNRNIKQLTSGVSNKKYTIVKVRAKQLGYTDQQIGSGGQLGTFVKKQVKPSFQENIGKYPVYHYEITQDLDNSINDYFNKSNRWILN